MTGLVNPGDRARPEPFDLGARWAIPDGEQRVAEGRFAAAIRWGPRIEQQDVTMALQIRLVAVAKADDVNRLAGERRKSAQWGRPTTPLVAVNHCDRDLVNRHDLFRRILCRKLRGIVIAENGIRRRYLAQELHGEGRGVIAAMKNSADPCRFETFDERAG